MKLVVEGEVFRPEDELRGTRLEVRIAEPQKVETERAVRRWNEAVRQPLVGTVGGIEKIIEHL